MTASMVRPRGVSELRMPGLDGPLIIAVAILLGFGVLMVASASMHLGERGATNVYHVARHLLALLLGTGAAWLVYRTPTEWWRKSSTVLYFVGLFLLVLVFVPGLGREANGAQRWVAAGPLSLQTSEFMKLFIVLYVSGYLVRRQLEVAHTVWGSVHWSRLSGSRHTVWNGSLLF